MPQDHDPSPFPWALLGTILGLVFLAALCLCGGLVFWMMLGSPSLLDPSALAE